MATQIWSPPTIAGCVGEGLDKGSNGRECSPSIACTEVGQFTSSLYVPGAFQCLPSAGTEIKRILQ